MGLADGQAWERDYGAPTNPPARKSGGRKETPGDRDEQFRAALWAAFRKLQKRYAEEGQSLGVDSPVTYANEKINAMSNVDLIDALT